VTHVACERDHERCARQRFLPDGPLAFLPLADGRVSIVWSMSAASARALQAASETEFLQALQEASDGVLGNLSDAVGARIVPAAHAARTALRTVRSGTDR
jgi:2-polyprenylphenol 6-hydroxylase